MRRFTAVLALLGLTGSNCDPTPPATPASGAWAVSFIQPDPNRCHVTGHNMQVGTVDASAYGPLVTDGMEGASVSCETIDGGDAHFTVLARVEQDGNTLDVEVHDVGPGSEQESPSNATVRLTDIKTGGELTDDTCSAWFADGTGQSVAGGKAWFTFSCDALSGPSDEGCAISGGYFIVVNCTAN